MVAYLAARGIDPATAERFRLGFVASPEPGHEHVTGRLAIPSLGVAGPVALRFRCLQPHICKDADCPKYLGLSGHPTRMFNTRALHEAGDGIAITEGELDAVILGRCGVQAVAVPGAKNWKAHYSRLFAGFNSVLVCEDGDTAGREFSRKVATEVWSAQIVTMGEGQDVTDVFLQGGEASVLERLGLADSGDPGGGGLVP